MNRRAEATGGHGAVLVELALVFAFLLPPILFGLVELGRGLYQEHILAKGVESGARYLVRKPQAVSVDTETETCGHGPAWDTGEDKAANLVVYGNPFGGSTPLLPNLEKDNVSATVRWAKASKPGMAGSPCVIRVKASAPFDPVIAPDDFLGLGGLILKGMAEERFIGE